MPTRKPIRLAASTTRERYDALSNSLGGLIVSHALEARRHRRWYRTSVIPAPLALDASLRERRMARALCAELRQWLRSAEFRAVFRQMRLNYRARLATEREADALVAQTRLGQLLQRESTLLCRAA